MYITYICLYIYIHTHTYIYMFVCMCVCVCVCINLYIKKYIYRYINVRMYNNVIPVPEKSYHFQFSLVFTNYF